MTRRRLFFKVLFAAFLVLGLWNFTLRGFRAPASAPASSNLTNVPIPIPVLPSPTNHCGDVYQMICHKRGIIKDPTGAVRTDVEGEKRALRIYEEIIHKHHDWNSDQIDEELVRQIFNPKRRGRLESVFRWVQAKMQKFFDKQPDDIFTPREKHQIKERIRKTQLQLPPPAKMYADEPDLFTKNDVYFERTQDGQRRLRVGGAYVFVAKSWFNLVFTFAHELAHAIDPCEIRAARLSFPAYDHLYACFLKSKVVASRKTRAECGNNDQLSETFADWVAVQITAEALLSFSAEFHGQQLMNAAINSVRDLCDQEEEDDEPETSFHPSPQIRIKEIFGNNPKIRQILGCEPGAVPPPYCSFEREP